MVGEAGEGAIREWLGGRRRVTAVEAEQILVQVQADLTTVGRHEFGAADLEAIDVALESLHLAAERERCRTQVDSLMRQMAQAFRPGGH